MHYENTRQAVFLCRPNRFIAKIFIDGTEQLAHVKNTGRCRELLTSGAVVIVEEFHSEKRKTKFDIIAVYKGEMLINMDSQAPNKAMGEWLAEGKLYDKPTLIKPEKTYGGSRFDFYMEAQGKKIFAEVKGVTLEENAVVLFPDAPTERGLKHIHELCRCMEEGYEAWLIFVVQLKGAEYFTPNNRTQPAFGEALSQAKGKGMHLLAMDCTVTENSMDIDREVEIRL